MANFNFKKCMGSVVLLALFASLSGCASGWVKAGSNDSDFAVDQKVCVAKAKATNDSQNMMGQYSDEGILTNHCLEELGWTKTDNHDHEVNRSIASFPSQHK